MAKTYFTSDTHFNHYNIISYCNRPYTSVDEMNKDMILKWNSRVATEDTVYHLGDFAMGDHAHWKSFRDQLNGKLILVKGNHDKSLTFMKDTVGFDEVYEKTTWNGWMLAHHPIKTNKKLLCGHIHTRWCRIGWTINVGVDRWEFTPRTIDELMHAPQDQATFNCNHCQAKLHRLENNSTHYEGKCVPPHKRNFAA